MMTTIFIKNMVCPRCEEVVRNIFNGLAIPIHTISLGKVDTPKAITKSQRTQLAQRLETHGFVLLNDQQAQLINQIKSIVIEYIHHRDLEKHINFSQLLTEKLHRDYSYLSRLFSEVEGRTIQHFIIAQKVEKVKELLTYGELNLSQIAYALGYSSPAHLSNQFKKMTGMTPMAFKKLVKQNRRCLDKV